MQRQMQSTPAALSFSEEEIRQRHAAKRRRNNWIAILLIAVPLLWAVPTFFYLRAETAAKNSTCRYHLKQLAQAIAQYRFDSDDKFPQAKNWLAPLGGYCGVDCKYDAKTLRCPADHRTEGFSYAMNANLSGKKLSEIKDPHNTILLYETTSKASTPHGTGKDLVSIGKETVGLGRHNTVGYRFNYYLMADGTVRAPQNVAEVKTYKWTP
jgi:hypothetical protein